MHSDSISVGCCSSSSALRGRNKGPVAGDPAAAGEGPTAAPGGPGCTAPLADIIPRAAQRATSGFRGARGLTSYSRCSRPFLKRPQTPRFLGQSLTKTSGSWTVLDRTCATLIQFSASLASCGSSTRVASLSPGLYKMPEDKGTSLPWNPLGCALKTVLRPCLGPRSGYLASPLPASLTPQLISVPLSTVPNSKYTALPFTASHPHRIHCLILFPN